MEEQSPPAVPPKDAGHSSGMNGASRPSTATSGSKRKRQYQDYDFRSGRLEADDLNGHTPKRSRSHVDTSDDEDSNDETPMQNRSVRRKKGHSNLSTLNLRHAASLQAGTQHQESPIRESRFQEGSLNDHPSEKPPSVFTKLPHIASGELSYREELMDDYQEGIPTPVNSFDAALQYEKDTRDQHVADIMARQKKEDNGGIFRFGKSLASAFHPVTLWNRLWSEQKDELIRENMLEAERKARHKADAEEAYAAMKRAGQLSSQAMSFETHRDSGVAFNEGLAEDKKRDFTLSGTMLCQNQAEDHDHEDSGIEESAAKPGRRGLKSRLRLRPSLQSLSNSIVKRVRSDANIRSSVHQQSSSSASPTKVDSSEHDLLRSASKHDLKRQHKLSKRVSDLEAKLNKARNELDDALVQASPMPKLGSRFERFTPVSTLRRSRFVPGALATLPSEGVLFPKQISDKSEEQDTARGSTSDARTWQPLDLSKAFDNIYEDDETVKVPRVRTDLPHAKDIFKKSENVEQELPETDTNNNDHFKSITHEAETSCVPAKTGAMDPNNVTDLKSEDALSQAPVSSYDTLDAKLKALESNVKAASRKPNKSKKRAAHKDDLREFKPAQDDDDDAEWEAPLKNNKKRKSTGVGDNPSPKQRTTRKKSVKSLQRKAVEATASNAAGGVEENEHEDKQIVVVHEETVVQTAAVIQDDSEDELSKAASRRASITSEDVTLEPVYEEEEETTTVPLKDAPSKPTAKATPARFGYNAARSRSHSPHKHIERIVEESMVAHAGDAASRKRPSHSASPRNGMQQSGNNASPMVAGRRGVPLLSKSPNGKVKTIQSPDSRAKENFEWPEDVF